MDSPGKAAPPVRPCWVRDGEGPLCIAGLAPGALSPTSRMAGSAWWKHRRAERLAALSWTTGVWGCLGVPVLCQGPSTWWASGAAGYRDGNGGARGGGGAGGGREGEGGGTPLGLSVSLPLWTGPLPLPPLFSGACRPWTLSGVDSLREREGRFGVKVRGRNSAAKVTVQTTCQTRVVLRGSWLCAQGGGIPWTTRLVSSQAPGPSRAAAHCRGGREDRPHG